MKVYAEVYAESGYVHTITGTSANKYDVSKDDFIVYGDSGYLSAHGQLEIKDNKVLSKDTTGTG